MGECMIWFCQAFKASKVPGRFCQAHRRRLYRNGCRGWRTDDIRKQMIHNVTFVYILCLAWGRKVNHLRSTHTRFACLPSLASTARPP